MIKSRQADEHCGVAQSAAVLGDWWSLLVLREIARGHRRFDELATELDISRKVLTERLGHLVERGVLARRPYSLRPPRHEYVLTPAGHGLLPVLVAMQDWADRWVLGDGTLTAISSQGPELARTQSLSGSRVPAGITLPSTSGQPIDVVGDAAYTVLFTYPATGGGTGGDTGADTGADKGAGWRAIPGTAGCTLENRLFRAAFPDFAQAGAAVHGVSTQQPDEQAAFAAAEDIPFPLLSDVDLELTAALRLPTFRGAQQIRHKRAILVINAERVVRHAIYPITDIPAAVDQALQLVRG